MVFGDRSRATNSSRKGRKQATSVSPGGRSFSNPIHEHGQPSRPRQYFSRSRGTRLIVEVFPADWFTMELITILNRCHHFRGFICHNAHFSPDHKSIEISVRPRQGSAAICS